MAKKKKAAKKTATPRKRAKKATAKKPWHICDDCIDPIADGLADIVHRWNRPALKPPDPREIKRIYERHDLGFGLVWLKLCQSVDFAKDLEDTLQAPLQQFFQLDFRACQVLDGNPPDEKGVTWQWCAVSTLLEKHYKALSANHDLDREDDSVLREFEEPYSEIDHAFRDAERYLRQVSAVLRARFERRRVGKSDIPADKKNGPWSPADTPQRLAKDFGVSVRVFKKQCKKGVIRHKPLSDRSYQIHVDDLPQG